MVKKPKEKPLASVILENSPLELELARLLKATKKEAKGRKKRPSTP